MPTSPALNFQRLAIIRPCFVLSSGKKEPDYSYLLDWKLICYPRTTYEGPIRFTGFEPMYTRLMEV
jgi:hypothetical protein